MPRLSPKLVGGAALGAVALSLVAWRFAGSSPTAADPLVARVKAGDFHVTVTTTGELRAIHSVQVQGPGNLPQAQIYQPIKIATLVPEGTVVKAGDVVAELDRGAAAGKLSEITLNVQKADAQYTQAQLDSTLNLSKAREEMRTLEYAMEEKRLAKEQAQYEAPSIRRQADIDMEKATRALAQAKRDYETKTQQAKAKMSEVGAELERQKNNLKIIQDVVGAFTIKAPAPGMVIYAKEWNGRKKTVGSQVSPWEPTVATLPDLTSMESITYVNEIDVRKLAVGQPVRLSLDSDPSKVLTGKVTAVANVGEQRPNTDAKVFEVKVQVMQSDTTLRPGMTTSNAVETAVVKNARFIPLEALVAEGGRTFVYKRDGSRVVKQEIETGLMNDNEVIVTRGLGANEEVLLAAPADAATLAVVALPGGAKTPAPGKPGDTAAHATVPAVPNAKR
ncbi:secretion protein HlyD family protein [Gemmatirosa kalamazoonensis]|uniref:Secretion protein HlyD family protein n=1 Tax=Gemmatirosa kalamazoonensis TaxID=861299 RepID=W0RCM1_9BACT|nr:HlyD family efflux transporter periplasmic adaptor subunit [Gemmatirosa kalamazoonensis]AHG88854.1 secretion protein HlyD family protein [Gemmatirosa kalamazoonensis]